MSFQVIPFDSAKVPANISTMFSDTANDLVGNSAGQGFPVISIKGKVFHITRGGEKLLVTKPGEDDPAASLEVVVIRANPNKSKVYYESGYIEGSDSKPTCYSNNGVSPEADATEPQAKKCAVCPHNIWGSKITESGKQGKSCADSRRLAVATVDTPNDPMLIRVPAASMKSLEEYGKILAARGVPPQAVVTKIGFDYSVAHPALTFKPVGLIGDPVALAEIKTASDSALAAQIIGLPLTGAQEAAEAPAETPKAIAAPTPAPAPAKPAVVKAAPKPAKPATVAAAPVEVKQAPVVVAASNTAGLEGEIASMIDDMNFDD